MDMHGSLDTHEGKVICHIFAFLVLTAYNQVLEQGITSKALSAGRVTDFVEVI